MTPSKRTFTNAIRCAFIAGACALIACSWGGGSGTEIGAVISGSVVGTSGVPIPGATVRVRPVNYLSGDSAGPGSSVASLAISAVDAVTDSAGNFVIDSIANGTFSLEVVGDDGQGALTSFAVTSAGSKIVVPTETLEPLAEFTGSLTIDDPAGITQVWQASIQVRDLEIFTKPDSLGHFSIALPAGDHRIRFSLDSAIFDKVEVAITAHAGERKDIGSFILHAVRPPFTPCTDGSCDSMVLRDFLKTVTKKTLKFDSVAVFRNGRLAELTLDDLYLDSLPFSFAQFSALEVLRMNYSHFPSLPRCIGYMRNLRVLYLERNHMTSLDESLGLLTKIDTLDISGNLLYSLPKSIVNLRPKWLHVGYNYFNFLYPLPSPQTAWVNTYDPHGWATQRKVEVPITW
jgi:hypothetical protein